MDGVIADTEPLHFKAYQQVLKDFGKDAPDSEAVLHVGMSEEDIWHMANEKHKISITFQEFEKMRRIKFFLQLRDITPNDGLFDLLNSIKEDDLQIGLVTSSGKEVADKIMGLFGLSSYFDVIITGDDVKNKKPDKEPYMLAMKKLSVECSECIAIEDSKKGIMSAKAAGIRCIALQQNIKGICDAEWCIRSLKEIIQIKKQVNPDHN